MGIISIEKMIFCSPIGCFDEEKIILPRFSVDVFLSFNSSDAINGDRLENTINYQEVYLQIKKVMQEKHNLIETVANKIISNIFDNFLSVTYARCKIYKLNPPLGGEIGFVSFELEKER